MARPQKLTDAEILSVINALRSANLPATGVDVRRELQRRYSLRAGTDRLYRLLREFPEVPDLSAGPMIDLAGLTHERDAALRRAQIAEYREEATQERAAQQIDALRERLRDLGVDPFASDLPSGSRPFPV